MGRVVKRNSGLFHTFLGGGLLHGIHLTRLFEEKGRLARGVRQPVAKVRLDHAGLRSFFGSANLFERISGGQFG